MLILARNDSKIAGAKPIVLRFCACFFGIVSDKNTGS